MAKAAALEFMAQVPALQAAEQALETSIDYLAAVESILKLWPKVSRTEQATTTRGREVAATELHLAQHCCNTSPLRGRCLTITLDWNLDECCG